MTDFGYILPDGWALVGDGQGEDDDYNMVAATLKAGEDTYAYFDVYRPTPEPFRVHARGKAETAKELTELDNYNCQTKINLSVRYHQERTEEDKDVSDTGAEDDYVSLDHSATVLWSSPISVVFSSKSQDAFPSGNRHSSNIIPDHTDPGVPEKEMILIDNEKLLTKGTIEAIASADGLNVEINKVQFTDIESENAHCKFQLLSGHGNDGTIYKGELNNPCQTLRSGSKISFAWMTEVSMETAYREELLSASLGTLSIHWQPSSMKLSEEVKFMKEDSFAGSHGPLKLRRPATCHFSGPLCYIESAPFDAKAEHLPDSIQIAAPFDVTYSIRNKTPIDQEVEMLLQDSSSPGDESNDAFLISGLVNKRTSLGPFESRSFSYTAVPMKVGQVDLPSISISSKRYRTWIVRESSERRSIYVLP